MAHVSLEDQPSAVRDFFLSLPSEPTGSVVEMNGRAVAVVYPPTAAAPEVADQEWTPERNRRRCELLDRKYKSGLTPPEEAELAALEAAIDRYIDTVAPLPLEGVRSLLQRLTEKAKNQAG